MQRQTQGQDTAASIEHMHLPVPARVGHHFSPPTPPLVAGRAHEHPGAVGGPPEPHGTVEGRLEPQGWVACWSAQTLMTGPEMWS